MFHKEKPDYNRNRYGFYTLDQLVPEDYGIEDVDFATVWGYGHTEAEITGTSSENFIDWVNESLEN